VSRVSKRLSSDNLSTKRKQNKKITLEKYKKKISLG
jgi:hypothetical protein